jgi:membrane protein implicated in regulation of membrane protease activity
MLPWWAWAIVAAAIGFGELHAPGSYLIWIAFGAAATAAVSAALAVSLTVQIEVFAAASALACLLGYSIYRATGRRLPAAALLNRRELLAVGEHGSVCEGLVNGRGKVRLGDTVWLAEGPDLPVDARVVVTAVRGARLIVEAAESGRPAAVAGR